MTPLIRSTPPAVEDVAEMIATADKTAAATLRDATDPQIELPEITHQDVEAGGYGSEHRTELRALIARWTYDSPMLGPRPHAATVIQCIEGGRSGGEGYAIARQWVSPRVALTPTQLTAAADLILSDALPTKTLDVDL